MQGSDVVFAKSYRGDVLLTIIWYGPAGRYYVSLTPAGGEEQALVDTLFPSIYGKRRGAALATYAPPADLPLDATAAFTGEEGVAAAAAALEAAGSRASAAAAGSDGKDVVEDASDSKTAERAAAAGLKTSAVLPAWKLFSGVSVWEASEPVPDPDELRAQDDAEDDEDADEDDGDDGGEEEGEAAIDVGEDPSAAAAAGGLLGDELDGGLLDLSGGSGYTQVYAVMSPSPAALAAAAAAAAGSAGSASARSTSGGAAGAAAAGAGLIPRTAVFRFGDWVYAGQVDFPVEALRLGDVPFVLPALQKQQGRLAFLSEAKAFPLGALFERFHGWRAVLSCFRDAVPLLPFRLRY